MQIMKNHRISCDNNENHERIPCENQKQLKSYDTTLELLESWKSYYYMWESINHKNHRIPLEKHENHENLRILCEEHEKPLEINENHENHRMPFDNIESHENHKIPLEKKMIILKIIEFHLRIMKI